MKNRRQILFAFAKDNIDLFEVNEVMNKNNLPTVTKNEYTMWQQSIAPIIQSNMFYYNEFIVTGKLSVADLVQSINARRRRQIIS